MLVAAIQAPGNIIILFVPYFIKRLNSTLLTDSELSRKQNKRIICLIGSLKRQNEFFAFVDRYSVLCSVAGVMSAIEIEKIYAS